VTADTRVGSATSKTIVRKNLILRLAVPRFFVQGDEVVIFRPGPQLPGHRKDGARFARSQGPGPA